LNTNGTAVSLLAGIDLLTGKVKDRHRSREFIEFLKLHNAAYPAHTAIDLILDKHSALISKETNAWLAEQSVGRFKFTFTPKHGSCLNLVEGFFSKLARFVLRHIRVASKQELTDRIVAAMDFFNRDPVVHTWTYKLDKASSETGVLFDAPRPVPILKGGFALRLSTRLRSVIEGPSLGIAPSEASSVGRASANRRSR
jgi:DDE superfamily endonuclease